MQVGRGEKNSKSGARFEAEGDLFSYELCSLCFLGGSVLGGRRLKPAEGVSADFVFILFSQDLLPCP